MITLLKVGTLLVTLLVWSLLYSDPKSDLESESTDLSPHSSTVNLHCASVTSSEAVLSTGWIFSGFYAVDHADSSSILEVTVLSCLLNALFRSVLEIYPSKWNI